MKAFFFSLMAFALASLGVSSAKDTVAVYDLEGVLSESGTGAGGLFNLMDQDRPVTFFDVTRSLSRAATDEEVRAVVMEIDGAGLSFAQLQELRRHLLEIRSKGKPVWFYTENLSNGVALLGSAADHFVLMPEGNVGFSGLYSESLYFKGLLDKLGLKADVIHIGDFKSAGENLYREGPSEPARLQTRQLLDDFFGQLLQMTAEAREIPVEKVRAFVDAGWNTPEQALEAGLVDKLMYRTDLTSELQAKFEDADFDRSYAMEGIEAPEVDSIFDLFSLMFKGSSEGAAKKDFVAVVAMEGAISDASIAPVRKAILELVDDEKAKALVLRVDSPGGSALSSDLLWEATDEWRATERPFYVSMGNVAASGGYYISAGADKIFAEQGTITGSIGVVGMKLVFDEAMEKAGITVHREQRGANAGVMSMTQPFTKEEGELVRQSMKDVYGTFKKRIVDGRGQRLSKPIDELGGGRVYSGARAKELGLVDAIGGLNECVQAAATAVGVDASDLSAVRLVPRPKSPFEELFAAEDEEEGDILRMQGAADDPLSARLRTELLALPFLQALEPSQQQQLNAMFKQLRALRSGQVQLIGNVPALNW